MSNNKCSVDGCEKNNWGTYPSCWDHIEKALCFVDECKNYVTKRKVCFEHRKYYCILCGGKKIEIKTAEISWFKCNKCTSGSKDKKKKAKKEVQKSVGSSKKRVKKSEETFDINQFLKDNFIITNEKSDSVKKLVMFNKFRKQIKPDAKDLEIFKALRPFITYKKDWHDQDGLKGVFIGLKIK